jgi:hypothetical protein
MVTGAITSNNRNKTDTTATTLSEMIMERIVAAGVGANAAFNITDCTSPTPQTISVDPTGSSGSGRGAAVSSSTGNIDFTTAANPSTGYTASYVTCGVNGSQATYDVRWNVTTVASSGSTVYSKLITVSARQVAGSSSNSLVKFFAPPVTLRTMITN